MFTKKRILISIISLFVLSGMVFVGQDYMNLRKRVYDKSYTTNEVDKEIKSARRTSYNYSNNLRDNLRDDIEGNNDRLSELENKFKDSKSNNKNNNTSSQVNREDVVRFCQNYDSLEYRTRLDELNYKYLC